LATRRRRWPWAKPSSLLPAVFMLAAVAGPGLVPAELSGQLPAFLLDDETQLRSIAFRHLDTETFPRSQLKRQIGLTEQGKAHRLKGALAALPLFSEPDAHPFDPLSLQRDVARLREFYRGAGFPDVDIRYEVTLDQEKNVVDVVFLIHEGRSRTLASVRYTDASGAPVEEKLAAELVPGWKRLVEREITQIGERFGDLERARMEGAPLQWLLDRGYPFPISSSVQAVDSAGYLAQLNIEVEPGTRSRVGSMEVEGVASVDDGVVLREVPIEEGDWFSASRVNEGRRRIFRVNLFRLALAEVTPLSQADSSVQVLFQVMEARPRNLSGHLGYTNVGGIALGGKWEHRNFLGGARTFAATVTSETGIMAVQADAPDEFFRGALSLRQPFVFVSGLSAVVSPFGEYRDDYRDQSWEAGLDGTLIYRLSALQAISLRYRISAREILEYRLEDAAAGSASLLGSKIVIDSLEGRIEVSTFNLSANLGRLDDPANPRRGFVLRPNLEVTAPLGFPTNEYFKAELWGSLYRPLGDKILLAANLRAGRIFPFGKSIPSSEEDGLQELIQLRDVNLMAGGPSDVRGWGSRLLGPKTPDSERDVSGSDTTYTASLYLPIGGLARVTGALDVQFPLPGLGERAQGHLFVDGGRVWTPDDRFFSTDDPYDQDRFFYSAGGGLGVETPVGPIRLSVGYKLNPSPLDLRDPGDVLALLLADQSILEAPTSNWRRVQMHLTVGRVF
jgi:outer membrane protein insertion porin family